MEKVEKKLTRFRSNLKSKRKLSLPMFINQFSQQYQAENNHQLNTKSSSRENLSASTQEEEEDSDENKEESNLFRDSLRAKQNQRNLSIKGSVLSSNLINASNTFGSLASIVFDNSGEGGGDASLLKRNLSYSISSGSGGSTGTTRHRSSSSTSSSSDSSNNSLNSSVKRNYSTLPHSASTIGLHLNLGSNGTNKSSSALGNNNSLLYNTLRATASSTNGVKPTANNATVSASNSNAKAQITPNLFAQNTASTLPRQLPTSIHSTLPRQLPTCINGASVYRNPMDSPRDSPRDWGVHPHLVATVSSPGGSTCTTLFMPNGRFQDLTINV